MSRTPSLELTLQVGELRRVVPVVAIAAALRLPRTVVEDALRFLLLGEPTEGVRNNQQPDPQPEGKDTTTIPGTTEQPTIPSDGRATPSDVLAEIVQALGPDVNPLAISRLVRLIPTHVLREALSLTVSRPAHEIRSSRSAYFTALVRALARNESPASHA